MFECSSSGSCFRKNSLLSAVSDDLFFSALRRCSVDRTWFWRKGERTGATVDGRNPANQLRLVVYQVYFILQGLYIPGGTGFLPSVP